MSQHWTPPAWSTPIVKTPTLGKGKACICCRRRKMRCDGSQPVCNQCVANGREMDCEYSDGVNPTRTEMLEERLAELQERLAELEGRSSGDESSGSTHAHDGRTDSSQSSNRNSHAARAAARLLGRPSGGSGSSARWWNNEMPPAQIAQALIETFFRHGEQLGFVLNTARLITALATPFNSTTYPHKALLNAIFLWGVRITASQAEATTGSTELRHLRDQEIALFERATKHLQAQLSSDSPRRGLQSIQAEVLLATYLFAKGRGLEGTYHLNAAVSLTTTFGIHRVQFRSGHGSATSTSRQSSAHGSADNVEEGERICTFWRVFQLDRLWAVASNSMAILQEREPSIKIGTPWPLTMAEYEAGGAHDEGSAHGSAVKEFLNSRARSSAGRSPLAMSTKSALLSERATRLACIRASSNDQNIFTETRQLDETIVRFISSLAPIPEDANATDKASLVGTHVQAYASLIHLHDSVSQNDITAYSSCVSAAKLIAATVGYLREEEIAYVNPFVTTSLTVACKVLVRDMAVNRQHQQGSSSKTISETELQMIMRVLKQLKRVYPVVDAQLGSIQATMDSLLISQ